MGNIHFIPTIASNNLNFSRINTWSIWFTVDFLTENRISQVIHQTISQMTSNFTNYLPAPFMTIPQNS
jgi:hypothetical protein